MNRKLLFPLVILSAGAMAGCEVFDDDDDPVASVPPAPQQFKLQVLHASADAPPVNVLVNGSETLSDVDYKEGSGALTLDAGIYTLQVDGILPGGTATVIGPVSLDFEQDKLYRVVAAGDVAGIGPVVLSQDDTAVAPDQVRLRVLHAAPAAPSVSVFVTMPGADLSASAPVGSFEFGGDLGPVDVAAGDYQIRVTPEGDTSTVVFDSGTVTLNGGANLLVSAVPNTTTGDAPISLAVLDGAAASEILDIGSTARVRVIHASPDAPAVDVVVNDNFGAPLVENLAFPEFTGFVDVPPATYNAKVTPADNAGAVVIDTNLPLEAGVRYSVFAVDTLATIDALVAADDARRIATSAKVRLVHASPTALDVDIYVTAPGVDLTGVEPAFAGVPFKANTGFVELAPGRYDVTITPAGTKDAAIGPLAIDVAGGGIYTAVARDAQGGGGPLGVILLDDFLQ